MWKKTKIFRLPVVLIILGILPIFSVAICIGKGYAVVSETYSYIIASSAELAVGGECKITIMLKSETGVAIIEKSVTINSSRSSDEITQPEPTDANGQCTGKLSSRYPGTSNITAACEGKTITALFPRDIIRGCWLLDESAGNTVNDISIYKNNGTE